MLFSAWAPFANPSPLQTILTQFGMDLFRLAKQTAPSVQTQTVDKLAREASAAGMTATDMIAGSFLASDPNFERLMALASTARVVSELGAFNIRLKELEQTTEDDGKKITSLEQLVHVVLDPG